MKHLISTEGGYGSCRSPIHRAIEALDRAENPTEGSAELRSYPDAAGGYRSCRSPIYRAIEIDRAEMIDPSRRNLRSYPDATGGYGSCRSPMQQLGMQVGEAHGNSFD